MAYYNATANKCRPLMDDVEMIAKEILYQEVIEKTRKFVYHTQITSLSRFPPGIIERLKSQKIQKHVSLKEKLHVDARKTIIILLKHTSVASLPK